MSTFKQELEELTLESAGIALEKIISEIQEQAIQAASQGQCHLDYHVEGNIAPKLLEDSLIALGFTKSDLIIGLYGITISWIR